MNISTAIMSISVGADKSLVPGKILSGIFHAKFLCLLSGQTMFFLTDYIDIEAMQALKESVRIMRGKKGKLFYLQLSFMGIYLLGAIACGIGLLWVIPYMQVTMANFYRKITGEI